ncbi:hypothetical protein KBB08_03655 [Candidatus Gracilibacteria bacterium]|nr:hypothetical protein [Candidatus Gracilibacteria bacterium]
MAIWALIFNHQAKTSDHTSRLEVEQFFADHQAQFRSYVCDPDHDIVAVARQAIADGADTLVAGGGDGTISAVAAVVVDSPGVSLAVLPLGTYNNFAKTLGIPLTLADALPVVLRRNLVTIDIGQVNDVTFLNNSGIGVYPQLVKKREAEQGRGSSKRWALCKALWHACLHYPMLDLEFHLDGTLIRRCTPLVFVGNNQYRLSADSFGTRESLQESTLSLFITRATTYSGFIRLLAKALLGTIAEDADFDVFVVDQFAVVPKKKWLHVSVDGEVKSMKAPLHYRILPRALSVVSI